MGINAGVMNGVAMGSQGGGAALSALGAYSGAKAQQLALRGEAAFADLNARMAEQGAQQELMRGQHEVGAVTARAGQIKGSQRAAMSANGVDLGVGSAAEVLTSTDIMKETDANTVTANAVRAAWGQRVVATNYTNEANTKRANAKAISPGLAAGASLLGSAGQIASSWYTMSKLSGGNMPNAQNVTPRTF